MADLFGGNEESEDPSPGAEQLKAQEKRFSAESEPEHRPLADRMRPQSFDDYIGQ